MKYSYPDNLPPFDTEIENEKIINLCEQAGRHDLAKKIRLCPPKNPFKWDGCSLWFDSWDGKSFVHKCFIHDVAYWLGGTDVERLKEDAILVVGVAEVLNDTDMADTMWIGVRAGGGSAWKNRNFSWNYGNIGRDDLPIMA